MNTNKLDSQNSLEVKSMLVKDQNRGKFRMESTKNTKNIVSLGRSAGGLHCLDDILETLELNEIVKLFFTELNDAISCRGMRYIRASQGIDMLFGCTDTEMLALRVRHKGNDLGCLQFYRREPYSSYETKAIAALRDQFAMPLRNALQYREAEQAALTDEHTGAGNRSALQMTLHRELQALHRHQETSALLLIDIDDLKAVNDVYGHVMGDVVLKGITECLRGVVRETDEIFRYGGDEFVVFLKDSDRESALVIAERFRYAVAEKRFLCPDDYFCVSVSVGATLLDVCDSQQTVIERADKAAYMAKNNGKNQVCCLELDE